MRLEIMGQADASAWDKIIHSSINGSLYHTWKWLHIMEKYSNTRLFPLVFFDTGDNRPFGAIPLFHRKMMGLNMVFSPPPGSSVRLGPVLIDKGYSQHRFELTYLDFQEQTEKFIKDLKSNYTLIITNPGLLDIRPFTWAHYRVTPLYTYKLDLSQGENILWRNISKSIRFEVKQAQKNGLRVIESQDNSGIIYLYESLHKRYQDQHLNLGSHRDYIQELFETFDRSTLKVYLTVHEDRIVGSAMCAIYQGTITGLIGGARNQSHHLEATHYLDWEIISQSAAAGYKWYEEFGANTRHLCNSKAKYNPEPDIYFLMQKSDIFGSSAEKVYRLLKKKSL